ncbi:MAG: TerB family tellurite resistance protein [Pseudomonadota bacterium]
MLKRVLSLFGDREPPVREDVDPHVAAAALFAEASLLDGVYAEIESDRVKQILMEAFDLNEVRAEQVILEGEAAAEEAVDAHRFTKRVKLLPLAQREKVIEGLYYVALADGERCKFEDAFIRHVASLLHIADVRRAHAKQSAEQRHARD